jgi:hypothetical protein
MAAKKRVAKRLKAKTSQNPAQKKVTPAAQKKPAPNATGQQPAASAAAATGKKSAPNSTGQHPAASPTAAPAGAVRAARALPLKSPSPSPTLRVKRPLPSQVCAKGG